MTRPAAQKKRAAPARRSSDTSLRRFVVGAPISLADFLALPETELRYDRDARGRLVLMTPDDAVHHREPLSRLLHLLYAWVLQQRKTWRVVPEPGVAFPEIFDLEGRRVADSFLGLKAIEPDVVCFSRAPGFVPASSPGGMHHYSPGGIALVVEVASPRTWREDLGVGEADGVDRWRTYLDNGVPEYWFLNPSVEGCPVPPGTGLFLARDPDAKTYVPLPATRRKVVGDFRGLPVLSRGRVASRTLRGFKLDVAEFFGD